jgi:hypothetical protein
MKVKNGMGVRKIWVSAVSAVCIMAFPGTSLGYNFGEVGFQGMRFLYSQPLGGVYTNAWWSRKLTTRKGATTLDIFIVGTGKSADFKGVLRVFCRGTGHAWRHTRNFKTPLSGRPLRALVPNVVLLNARTLNCPKRVSGPPPRVGPVKRVTFAQRLCAVRQNLRSVAEGASMTLTFINRSTSTRNIRWVNYQGRAQGSSSTPAGGRYSVNTAVGHPFMVTDSRGRCLEIHVPRSGRKTIILRR